jgi:hypothetical protein
MTRFQKLSLLIGTLILVTLFALILILISRPAPVVIEAATGLQPAEIVGTQSNAIYQTGTAVRMANDRLYTEVAATLTARP